MVRLRNLAFSVLLLAAAGIAHAQTDVWVGGLPDDNIDTGNNWLSGTVPTVASDTLLFTSGSGNVLNLDAGGSFGTLEVTDPNSSSDNILITGGSTLALGSGGIALLPSGDGNLTVTINAPLMLTAVQQWTGGNITVNSLISGTGGLDLTAGVGLVSLLNPGNAFSGGVVIENADLQIASTGSPLGSGLLNLEGNSGLYVTPGASVVIANVTSFGDPTSGGAVWVGPNPEDTQPLFTTVKFGPDVTFIPNEDTFDQTLTVGANTEVIFAGNANSTGSILNLNGAGIGNSVAVFQGTLPSGYTINLENNASIIFDGTSSQLAGVTVNSENGSNGTYGGNYVGFGENFNTHMNAAIAVVGSPGNFVGTIGLDTVEGEPVTFLDSIDLTNFTQFGFEGLGSSTSAILSGLIIPVGGLAARYGTGYQFGGGGGTLQVTSALTNSTYTGNPHNTLIVSPGNGPLTLILSGTTTFGGASHIDGGVVVFDNPISTTDIYLGEDSTVGGYVGSTLNSQFTDASPQTFINLLDVSSAGVVGFDTLGGSRTITGAIDMTNYPGVFLGTATAATYSGAVTPSASGWEFSGVKGSQVTVLPSAFTSAAIPVTIGLGTPIESFGSVSSVVLPNDNPFSANVTLNSGYLYIGTSGALGTLGGEGVLTIAGPGDDGTGTIVGLRPYNASVTVAQEVTLPFEGAHFNYPGSAYTLDLEGVIADTELDGNMIVDGPVIIGGMNNSYDGTTTVNGTTLMVTSDTGTSTGNLVANAGSVVTYSSLSPVVAPGGRITLNDAQLDFTNVGGTPDLFNVVMNLGSAVNFADDSMPTIHTLQEDDASGNTILIGTDGNLTIDQDSQVTAFHGVISGDGGLTVQDGGLNLLGANTYTQGTAIAANGWAIASNAQAFGTGSIYLSGGLAVNQGITLTNALVLDDGSTLGGFGTFSPGSTLNIRNTTVLAPGSVAVSFPNNLYIPAVGILSFGAGTSLMLGGGGIYNFALSDANGAPGTGYSTITVAGGVSVTATPGTPFEIEINTFQPGGNSSSPNTAANFNAGSSYQWTLLSSAGGITNFNAADFTVDTSGFDNSTGLTGFSLSSDGTNLYLDFSPVPEPATYALLASGLAAVGGLARLRRRRA